MEDNEIGQLIQLAEEAILQNDLKSANVYLDKILAEHPEHLPALLCKAKATTDKLAKLKPLYRVLSIDPENLHAQNEISLLIAENIVDHKSISEELRARNEFIETIMENLPIGLAVNYIDSGKATFMNPKFEEIYGWPSELITDISEFFKHVYPDPAYREAIQSRIMADIESGDPERMSWEGIKIQTRDHGERYVNAKNIPVFDQNFMISTVQDVTQESQAKIELQQTLTELQLAVDTAMLGIWHLNTKQGKLEWNDQMCKMYGVSPQSFKENLDAWREQVHSEDKAYAEEYLSRLFEGQQVQNARFRVIRPDGEIRHIQASGTPLTSEDGKIIELIGINLDVTGIFRAEERYQSLYKAIPVPSYTWQKEGDNFILTDYNDAAYEITHSGILDLIGIKFTEMYSEDEQGRIELEACLETQEQIEREMEYTFKSTGETKILRVWYTFVPPNFVMIHTLDITEQKQAELAIKNMNEELEMKISERTIALAKTVEDLESFAYSVSHDLRAPLRAIKGFADILVSEQTDLSDEEAQHLLDRIAQNALKMDKLIMTLLSFSRLGREGVELSEVNFNQIVSEVIKGTDIEEKERWEVIIYDLGTHLTDSNLIKQVFMNLVSNAFKYSSKEENPCIEIGVEQDVDTDQQVFYIKDNGVGFDMRYADNIFGVFQRLHTDNEFQGLGIGLANVKKIIKYLGGKIWCTSKVGEGATFFFTIQSG